MISLQVVEYGTYIATHLTLRKGQVSTGNDLYRTLPTPSSRLLEQQDKQHPRNNWHKITLGDVMRKALQWYGEISLSTCDKSKPHLLFGGVHHYFNNANAYDAKVYFLCRDRFCLTLLA